MRTTVGDIWQVATLKDAVVIPTNLGWRTDGRAVMGAGIARQAAARFPGLASAYGVELREYYRSVAPAATPPMPPVWRPVTRLCRGLVLFPVKPLNVQEPWRSWQNEASLDLILEGLPVLHAAGLEWTKFRALTLLPLIGCGHGGLDEAVVVPLLEAALPEDNFVLIRMPEVEVP